MRTLKKKGKNTIVQAIQTIQALGSNVTKKILIIKINK